MSLKPAAALLPGFGLLRILLRSWQHCEWVSSLGGKKDIEIDATYLLYLVFMLLVSPKYVVFKTTAQTYKHDGLHLKGLIYGLAKPFQVILEQQRILDGGP